VVDLAGGFSPGATALLSCPASDLFVKAVVGTALNPDSPAMHRREAAISASLPDRPMFPHLVDSYDDGDWVALAFRAVDGHLPRHPWEESELRSVAAAVASLHEALTPSPCDTAHAAEYFRSFFNGWRRLAAGDQDAGELNEWARRHLERLAELEAGWVAASQGSTLIHGDLRSDNMLLTADGVVLVDWPHAAVGSPALDLAAWAPSVALEGGPQPEDLFSLQPSWQQMDPDVVIPLVAAVCGFFLSGAALPPPPGLPTLRAFQAAQGQVAMGWLQRLTGW
jgi:aminoglycoside phosphotransferase